VQVFEGNTADPKTFREAVQTVRARFGVRHVVWVGDRGMITEARIREDVRGQEGLDWITALRSPQIRGLARSGSIQMSLFDQQALAEVSSEAYPGERLIVCKNPVLGEERARKRKELLEATERELDKIVEATRRAKRALRGKDRIGVRVGKVLNRFKVGKHFRQTITEEGFSYERDAEGIVEEAMLDGVYVIRTSVAAEQLSAEGTVEAYKRLSRVERAFRSLKTMDLKLRPIHHHLADRVRAHAFLCMLAYYVEWHMRAAWAPILFDDDDKEGAEALRDSVVSPAERSDRAKEKAYTKRTEDDLPVHSFQTLLKDLGTITRNRCRVKCRAGAQSPQEVQGNEERGRETRPEWEPASKGQRRLKGAGPQTRELPTFQKTTQATRVQQRALDLLAVRL
jgi:transposase